MPYDPGPDVVAVQRGPRPGGAGGVYRAFGETLRGLKTTFARIVEGPHTIQYPEEKTPVYPRFRGRHKLHRFEDTGLEKCVGCSLCAAACPADCIRVVAAENTPEQRVSAGERYAAVYEINMSRCIFCGYCEAACPFYTVLALVVHLLSLAAMFLLLRAEFVAAAQVIVYVGAVMVLYLFVVAYVGGGDDPIRAAGTPSLRWASLLFAIALFAEL